MLKQNKSITNCRMDKYLKRKNVNENEKASNEKKLNAVMRHYSNSYISFAFAYTGDLTFPKPVCLVCRKEPCNSTMVPAKLKCYLETRAGALEHGATEPVNFEGARAGAIKIFAGSSS